MCIFIFLQFRVSHVRHYDGYVVGRLVGLYYRTLFDDADSPFSLLKSNENTQLFSGMAIRSLGILE